MGGCRGPVQSRFSSQKTRRGAFENSHTPLTVLRHTPARRRGRSSSHFGKWSRPYERCCTQASPNWISSRNGSGCNRIVVRRTKCHPLACRHPWRVGFQHADWRLQQLRSLADGAHDLQLQHHVRRPHPGIGSRHEWNWRRCSMGRKRLGRHGNACRRHRARRLRHVHDDGERRVCNVTRKLRCLQRAAQQQRTDDGAVAIPVGRVGNICRHRKPHHVGLDDDGRRQCASRDHAERNFQSAEYCCRHHRHLSRRELRGLVERRHVVFERSFEDHGARLHRQRHHHSGRIGSGSVLERSRWMGLVVAGLWWKWRLGGWCRSLGPHEDGELRRHGRHRDDHRHRVGGQWRRVQRGFGG